MRVEIFGEGDPEYAVVASVHGDELCGWHAFNRLKDSDYELEGALKFIIANEKGFRYGKRFIDTNMNRCSEGELESDEYEEREAAKLRDELKDLKVLDIHSTESKKCPFAIIVGQNSEDVDLARSTGLERLVDMEYVDGGITRGINGVVVECGYLDDESAADMAYDILVNFLAAEGLIDEEYERSDPDLFEVFDKEKGSDFEFVAENFNPVEEGEVFARKENKLKRAEEKFWPVLMSTDGYDDIIGFKARLVGN